MGKFPVADQALLSVAVCLKCKARNPRTEKVCRKCGYKKLRPKKQKRKDAKGGA